MRLRITSIDEYQFLTCYQFSLWGSKRSRFKDWAKGDFLVFMVDKAFSGLAVVDGEPFKSTEKVWDNGVFPYRIPINFVFIINKENRPRLLGEVREAIIKAWGPKFGLGILNQMILEGEPAEVILKTLNSSPNNIEYFSNNLDQLLIEAKNERELKKSKKRKVRRKISNEKEALDEIPSPSEETLHLKTQKILIKIGKITGCMSWVATNDRGKVIQDDSIKDCYLNSLPKMGLDEEASNRISLIDVIWFKGNNPIYAFEIETTTSIYSGILRMSDLVSIVPAINIQLFIIAPKDRENKVQNEILRPTFQKIGLNDYCKFLSIDDLFELYEKIKNFSGYIQPNIIEKNATSFEEKKYY